MVLKIMMKKKLIVEDLVLIAWIVLGCLLFLLMINRRKRSYLILENYLNKIFVKFIVK
jgi:hypothetical protein